MVSVSISVDCCVLSFFHRSHRFLFFLPLTCGRRNGRDADGSTWTGPKRRSLPQASLDERRSGRSAGTHTSLAVKPFYFSPPGGSWEIAVAISFWPAAVGRVGEVWISKASFIVDVVESSQRRDDADSEAYLLLLASRHHATTILFYC